MTDVGAAVNSLPVAQRPAPALLDSGSGAGMTDAGAAVNSVLPVAQSTPARPPGFRLVGRNDGCGGRRQLGSAGRTVDPAPSLLDSGSWAGMTDVGAAVNSVLPVAQSTRALPPGFRLVGRNDGCGGGRQLGSAGRAVDPPLPPGFRLVGRKDGCGGRRRLGSAGRAVDPAPSLLDSGSWAGMTDAGAAVNSVLPVAQSTPRPPSWIPARGPE